MKYTRLQKGKKKKTAFRTGFNQTQKENFSLPVHFRELPMESQNWNILERPCIKGEKKDMPLFHIRIREVQFRFPK